MQVLDRWFRLSEHGTTIRTEATAGVTTFLTLSYIFLFSPGLFILRYIWLGGS